jgi:hypothetical protein
VGGAGPPRRAGQAYAVNILGCILGPLAASHLLLPLIVERHALALLALPLFILALSQHRRLAFGRWPLAAGAALVVWSSAFAQASSEGPPGPRRQLRTDSTATVVALGEGMDRQLLVNGVGMTRLTTITKLMVHLPLAMRREPPRKILIICFGMGTSFRSALSWGADTTAVELVPSVIESFGYFHDDAAAAVQNPLGHLVVDDGRRFLRRTQDKYDLIAIDPPPPVEAAGSGMLYSVEFYEEAKRHLAPGGVLQQWFPVGPLSSFRAVVGSLRRAFPHVRIFLGMDGWGAHLIASEEPLPVRGALELAARLPAAARRDLVEWLREGPPDPAAAAFGLVVDGELTARLPEGEEAWITDDLPLNEYVWLAHRLHPPGHGPVHPRLAPALGPVP